MLKVAIIGFGGIAKAAHLGPHIELEKEGKSKLVAVCDICPETFTGSAEINIASSSVTLGDDVNKYTDWEEMLDKEDIDVVDICLPTFLHESMSVNVLKRGVNVICEKPMSLSYELCMNMCDEAKKNGRKLMIAQCCRFNSSYLYLKKLVDEGTYGKIKSAVFKRLSGPPKWSWNNWFRDYNLSGGCILDMHIHDIDLFRFILGNPKKVSCFTSDFYTKKDIAHSRLVYDDFSVIAIGDWSREGTLFEAGFDVAFENATVIGDSKGVTVYLRNGEKFEAEIENADMYKAELEYFIDCVANDKENILNAPEDSATTVKLIETLVKSAENNGEFIDFN